MKSLKDILNAVNYATCLHWWRGDYTHVRGTLTVFIDNIPGDHREVHTVRITPRAVYHDLATLSGYDAKKHMWTRYEEKRAGEREIKRAGEKALRAHLSKLAQEVTGCPNPDSFSYYAGSAQ